MLLPLYEASRVPDGLWHINYTVRNAIGHPTENRESYDGGTGTLSWRTTTFEYAANLIDLTRIVESGVAIATKTYTASHRVGTSRNALDELTTYSYDELNRLTNTTNPNGLVVSRSYDSTSGFLSTVIESDGTTNLRTNSYTYTNGLVWTHTDERGLTITNAYDALSRRVRTSYPDGTFTTNTYDKLDLVRTQDRMGFTNRFEYNGFRQVAKSIDASGRTNSDQYCDCGSLNSMTDALGNTTSYSYDNLGRRTRTTFPGGSYQDSVYDIANRVIRTADNSGISVTNYYTVNGLLCVSSNAAGQIVRKTYDDHDRMSEAVDRNGVWTAFRYDELNRPIDRVISRTVTIDGPDTYTHEMTEHFDYTNYVRGAVGTYRALLQFAEWSGVPVWTNSLPVGPSTSFGYDLFDRKTNEIHWDTNGVAMMTNRFAYNAAGDLVTLIDGKSQTTIWKYDLHGRVTNKVDTTSAELFRYAYDANGRLTSRWSAEKGTTAYSYDAVGNVTSVNYPVSSDITLGYDALNRLTNMVDAVGTTRYDYTSFGALQSEDGPWADDTVTYSYSANRLRNGFSLAQPNASPWSMAYGYDAASRLSSVTSPAGTFDYEFASVTNVLTASQLIRRLGLPNGSAITNQFDERGRWLGTTLRSSTGTLLNQHLYAYNELDQRTQQTRAGGDFVDYGYDDLGQLTSAKGKESGGTTNRLNEQFGYTYDTAGNLARRTNNLLVQSFAVNNLNQLSNATRSGTLTVAGGTYGPATSVTVNTLTADRYADHTFARTNLTLADGNNTFTAIATDSLSRSATNAITVNLPATVTFLYDLNGNLRTNGTRVFLKGS
jgi:YD repeat-containing protein